MFVCSVKLQTFFDHYKLLSTAMYYFWHPYTTFDGYRLLLTAIYDIWRLYITFDSYILLLLYLPTISFLCGLNTRLEFNINLLALMQFGFFCHSMVSPLTFNLPFWKRCFIRNNQMIKMWNFQALRKWS